MSDKKHEAAKQSYQTSPELHVLEIPTLTEKEKVSNCQMCGTGRGKKVPGDRHQTAAVWKCMKCDVNVCGVGCWKLLHGYYQEGAEWEEKPKKFRGKSATAQS